MITFWLVCGIFIAMALAFILPPLLQEFDTAGKLDNGGSKEATIAVYRDQLAELEADLGNGIVTGEQYSQDRDEIERRMLEDVAPASDFSHRRPKPAPARQRAAYALALGLPILAIAFYLRIGNPSGTATRPTVSPVSQANLETPGSSGDFSEQSIEANVALLAKRLEQDPGDTQGWIMLARSYSTLEKYREASEAYRKATALKLDDADLWADYAFVLAMANGRQLQGQPVELIDKALKIDPENSKALELAGSAAFEAKDYERAVAYWQGLMQKVPADSEVAVSLSQRIGEAQRRSGISGSK